MEWNLSQSLSCPVLVLMRFSGKLRYDLKISILLILKLSNR